MNDKKGTIIIPGHPTAERCEAFSRFTPAEAQPVRAYHESFPGYAPTPLRRLDALAGTLGVGAIFVKDESFRFGLNAFKSLGGSYAIGRYLAEASGRGLSCLNYDDLMTVSAGQSLTFVTATDGNHGRGIAWSAHIIGQKSVVYMPRGTAPERLENIRKLGADASITDLDYDGCVALASRMADEKGWILVQDTAWPGYEEIPTRIMQGYLTMADEAAQQAGEQPTHIFLQAGVGSMAAAVAAYFASRGPKPIITIVEPHAANCFFATAQANDDRLHSVPSLDTTIMAGLNCGSCSTIAWDILSTVTDFYASIPDNVAAEGMRVLGNPLPGDERVIAGESGASCFGLVSALLRRPSLVGYRDMLRLNSTSRILCISTEGDTDRKNYRRVVWDGAYAPTE